MSHHRSSGPGSDTASASSCSPLGNLSPHRLNCRCWVDEDGQDLWRVGEAYGYACAIDDVLRGFYDDDDVFITTVNKKKLKFIM